MAAGCGNDDQGGQARNLGEDGSTGTTVKGGTATTVAGSEAACEVQGGVATQGTDVIVTLLEWKVTPSVSRVGPGIVSFVAESVTVVAVSGIARRGYSRQASTNRASCSTVAR